MESGLGAPLLPSYLQPPMRWTSTPACTECGSRPAVKVCFRQTTGLVVAWKRSRFEATMCRDCAIALGNDVSRRTMRTGWWTVFSPIVNTLTLLGNARAIRRLRRMPAPVAFTRTATR
jgi:hypothetical protein